MAAHLPDWRIITLALLYSLGAHGIMTLNDFKAIEGDQRMGILSLPVQLGVLKAVKLACIVMAAPQIVVILLLLNWSHPIHAAIVVALLGGQLALMSTLLEDPQKKAAWYNATGTTLYVAGMLVSAFALRSNGAGLS
jgi:chlorophyll synthase